MSLPPYIVPHSQETTRILYEDDDLLLVCKPHLLLTVPGRHPLNKDCMITRLQADYPSASVVHRLDLDTSGLLIVPLNKSAHSHISRQFQERQVEKSYDAVVWGEVESDTGEIDLPIAADWENRPRQMIDHERGKSALTRYQVIHRAGDRTRVLLKPVTGRSHQLRIHMRELGHPILGCDMYAHDEALAMSPRLLLHASWIRFSHPVTKEPIEGHCPAEF